MTPPTAYEIREAQWRNKLVLAIDPGPVKSAFVLFDGEDLHDHGIEVDDWFLALFRGEAIDAEAFDDGWGTVVIEQVRSYGMAVGAEVFDTVHWCGRFEQAVWPSPVVLVPRLKVKTHLCGSAKAKDPNVRQALIDRFGGPTAIKKGGPLYKVASDVWSALALAVTYADGAAT